MWIRDAVCAIRSRYYAFVWARVRHACVQGAHPSFACKPIKTNACVCAYVCVCETNTYIYIYIYIMYVYICIYTYVCVWGGGGGRPMVDGDRAHHSEIPPPIQASALIADPIPFGFGFPPTDVLPYCFCFLLVLLLHDEEPSSLSLVGFIGSCK